LENNSDYHALNQVVTPVVAVVPDVVSLLTQINIVLGTWGAIIDLENVFFHIYVYKAYQKQLPAGKASSEPLLFSLRDISSQALCHNLVFKDLDHLFFAHGITLAHYIDDTTLNRPSEKEVATILGMLARHLYVRE
jgi:hypothetical protein